MTKYSRIVLDEVKNRVDIVELITSYGVELKKSGVRYAGLCPFHNERSPSFSVNPSAGFFHCFGCGEGGDAFAFVQKSDSCSFSEAVLGVANYVGYTLPVEEETEEEKRAAEDREQVYRILEKCARWFHEKYLALPDGHPAKAELASEKRQLSSPALTEEFQIGYAPEGWSSTIDWLTEQGFSHHHINLSGMGVETQNGKFIDRFRGRITWPIRDIRGRAVGFGGRRIFDEDNGAKYLNSPETVVYKKSRTLYNLERARKAIVKEGRVYVVEGYTDIMACWDAGVENVVASSGTAFGDEHISTLRRLLDGYDDGKTGQIVFCFDGDEAGQKAARKTLDLDTPLQARSYVATLPERMDPCDYRAAEGNANLLSSLTDPKNKVPLVDFVLSNEAKLHDLKSANGRIAYLNACVPILRKIREDELRIQATRRVSYHSGVKLAQVESFLRQKDISPQELSQAVQQSASLDKKNPMDVPQRRLLAMMFQFPSIVPLCDKLGLSGEDFLTDEYQVIYYEILGFAHAMNTGSQFNHEFTNPTLEAELSNMYIREPSESSVMSLVMSLKKHHDDEVRTDAVNRLYGMTEEGFQGVYDTSFTAAGEVADLNIARLEKEEQEAALKEKLTARKTRTQALNERTFDDTLDSIMARVRSKSEGE